MADLHSLERLDGFAGTRNALRDIAEGIGEWAGIPMPIADRPLVIEPTYRNANELMRIVAPDPPGEAPAPGTRIRNEFWSWRHRCMILVWEEGGKICWGPSGPPNQIDKLLCTLGSADAWGFEQEAKALQLLGTLLPHRKFKQYALTGTFLESSRRSGVTYLFRRLRPTIALPMRGDRPRVLCALCLHPIAYYSDSWAGAIAPTDDVIAHLMLMRGDEPMFWRRSNQHPAYRMEAGIS